MGGDEVVEVELRFSAKVAYRVRESDWPGVVKREDVDTANALTVNKVAL